MTAEEFKKARIALGVTQDELAKLLKSRPRSVQDWEAGRRPISGPVEVALGLLQERDTWVTRYAVAQATAGYRG